MGRRGDDRLLKTIGGFCCCIGRRGSWRDGRNYDYAELMTRRATFARVLLSLLSDDPVFCTRPTWRRRSAILRRTAALACRTASFTRAILESLRSSTGCCCAREISPEPRCRGLRSSGRIPQPPAESVHSDANRAASARRPTGRPARQIAMHIRPPGVVSLAEPAVSLNILFRRIASSTKRPIDGLSLPPLQLLELTCVEIPGPATTFLTNLWDDAKRQLIPPRPSALSLALLGEDLRIPTLGGTPARSSICRPLTEASASWR